MAQITPARPWIKLVIGLLVLPVAVAACTAGTTQLLTYMAVHPTRERLTETPISRGLFFEEVGFATSDGIQLRGWFVPSRASKAAVILGHGFTRSRQELLDVAAMLNRGCYNVLLFDWRAHGESDGERSTFGLDEVKDLAAAVRYIASRPEVDQERIGVLGSSMGAAIAIRGAAVLPQIKAVVSDSPFPTLEETIEVGVRRRGPLGVWPLRPLVVALGSQAMGIDPDLVRPVDEIGDISPRPVLILHGGEDDLLPEDTGSRLYAAAAAPKSLWYVPEGTHARLASSHPLEYERRVVSFFDAALKTQGQVCSRSDAPGALWVGR
jgi:fermentation-respiration switch protein FrsA (DUF1100 family)